MPGERGRATFRIGIKFHLARRRWEGTIRIRVMLHLAQRGEGSRLESVKFVHCPKKRGGVTTRIGVKFEDGGRVPIRMGVKLHLA